MSNLSAIVYRSRAVVPLTDVDLFYLLAHARERNETSDLTGLLLYDRGYFFQWVEGAEDSLADTWSSIRHDARHTDITILADQQIPVRLFRHWHMRFAHRNRQHENIVDGFTVVDSTVLDDLHLNPEKTPNILAAFSSLGPRAWPPSGDR